MTLGVPVENGMRYPYKTEHFLTFTFSPQHNLSFCFHSVLFLYLGIVVFPKIHDFSPTLALSLYFSFLLHDLLSSGENLSSGMAGSVSASAFLHSVPVYLSM